MPSEWDKYVIPTQDSGGTAVADDPWAQYNVKTDPSQDTASDPWAQYNIKEPKPSTTPATDAAITYGSSGPTTAEAVGMENAFAAAHPKLYPEILGAVKAVKGMVPTSLEQAKAMIKPPIQAAAGEENVQKLQQEIVQGADQWGQAITGKLGPEAQGETIVGTALQAAPLLHLPFAKSPFAKISQTALDVSRLSDEAAAKAADVKPVPPENFQGVAGPTVESTTTASGDVTPVAQPGLPPEEVLPPDQTNVPTDTGAEAANLEVGQNGQGGVPPEYTPQMGFPAPAVEGEVRAPAKVTQAITLEEIRLMREKADLELQAHISQRATGQTHPAIELRIEEIDQELQDIVNNELGQQPPRVIPEAGAAEPAQANLEVGQQERPLTKSELRVSRKPEQGGGEPSARSITTSESVPVRDQGGGLGESPPLRQQGETADVPPQGGNVRGSTPEQATETQGISQARTEAELGAGSVEPGAGAEMGSGLAFGRKYINDGGDPRLPIRRAEKSGLVGKNEVGIVHAELERLRGVRDQAARIAEAHPEDLFAQDNLAKADNAQRAWRKELQPVLTKASDALREAYAESSVPDVGTYQGLANLMDEHFKGQHDITPADRTVLQKVSKTVSEGRKEVVRSVNGAVEATERQVRVKGEKPFTPEEFKADLAGVIKDFLSDCVL